MKKDVQGIILLLVGGMVLRLALGDQFLFYVAQAMRPWLVLSASVLVGLGVYLLWQVWTEHRAVRGTPDGPGDDHAHPGPRTAYLLLLPVLAVYVIAPAALGSYSAARQAPTAAVPVAPADLPALSGADPVEVPLRDYVVRAVWDDGRTLKGRTVSLTGFVTPNPDGGWWLTRMAMTCCAADAQASRIAVQEGPGFAADTWVTVTGTWVPGGGTADPAAIPIVRARQVVPVTPPRNPYE